MTYVLVVSVWQPRPDGWYEKRVTFYFSFGARVGHYHVDGAGYGPHRNWALEFLS